MVRGDEVRGVLVMVDDRSLAFAVVLILPGMDDEDTEREAEVG